MKTYEITIVDGTVNEWSKEHGASVEGGFFKEINQTTTIGKEQLTKKDILDAVVDMLYHCGVVDEDDLYDGDDSERDFLTFSRLENGESEELENGQDGYIVDYHIIFKEMKRMTVSEIS